MAISKTGGLANTICTPNGIVNKDTGKIIVVNDNSFYVHSKEFMDNWNKPTAVESLKTLAKGLDLPETGDITTSKASPEKTKVKPKKAKKKWFKKK